MDLGENQGGPKGDAPPPPGGKTLTLNFGPDGQIMANGQPADLGSVLKMVADMAEGGEPGEEAAAFNDGYAGKPMPPEAPAA